jgi:hypothetical protein
MWDKRVVNRMEVEVGDFVAACSFKNVDDVNGLLQGFMALMRIRIGAFYGMSWLV